MEGENRFGIELDTNQCHRSVRILSRSKLIAPITNSDRGGWERTVLKFALQITSRGMYGRRLKFQFAEDSAPFLLSLTG